jgi:hypothetical protein
MKTQRHGEKSLLVVSVELGINLLLFALFDVISLLGQL